MLCDVSTGCDYETPFITTSIASGLHAVSVRYADH